MISELQGWGLILEAEFASSLASRLAKQVLQSRGEVLASWLFELLQGGLLNLMGLGMKSFVDFKSLALVSTTFFPYQDCLIFDKTVLGRIPERLLKTSSCFHY